MSKKSNIKLSEEETKEIEKVLIDNKKRADNSNPEVIKAKKEAREAFLGIKKLLKQRNKNELIEMIWNYGTEFQSLQHAAQVLFEENQELKKQLGVEDVEESKEA